MALRVTQSMIYGTSLQGMNKTLSDYIESNIQSSSQLRINRPSDDPAGAARVVSQKALINNIEVYQDNISTATGWLNTIDYALSTNVTTLLTSLKELAEQGATGTYDGENREQMAYQIRQYYEQLINIANTQYNGQHVFSGHKTDTSAYVQALGVTVSDEGGLTDGDIISVDGSASYTILIQALEDGSADSVAFRYSSDGGTSWVVCDPNSSDQTEVDNYTAHVSLDYPDTDQMQIAIDGAVLTLNMDAQMNAVDTEESGNVDNGTWIYIRATALYQGDDTDTQVVVPYGGSNDSSEALAHGNFSKDVTIRIDENDGTTITYSYSTDDGSTWTQSTCQAGSPARLVAPGGYLDLENDPADGEQYVIHPHRADISLAISSTDSITINMVGKDVFGGVYQDPASGETQVVDNGGNIFEVVGNLLAAAETNNQQGMQEALDALNDCLNVVLTKAAVVGGRENRLELTSNALSMRKLDEKDALSAIQDIDVTELMLKLSQQQIAYNSVLKSSSMIMQMSLVNFL